MLSRYLHQPTFQIHKFLSTLSASKTSVQTEFNTLFNKKSKANSSIEKGRNLTAEEEQELIYEGPGTIAFDKIPTVTKTATNQYTYDYKQAASYVLSSGLCHFPNILDVNTAEQLRLHTNVVLDSSKQNVVDGKDKYLNLFGPIMSRNNRYDVLLPLDATVLDAVTEILLQIEPTMQELLGNDSYLCEMSALISDPNAVAQPIHHDTSFDGTPPRVSLLIALQDVDEDMGPTIFFPGKSVLCTTYATSSSNLLYSQYNSFINFFFNFYLHIISSFYYVHSNEYT